MLCQILITDWYRCTIAFAFLVFFQIQMKLKELHSLNVELGKQLEH